MPLEIAFAQVMKAAGGKRLFKKTYPDLYWEMQWEIGAQYT